MRGVRALRALNPSPAIGRADRIANCIERLRHAPETSEATLVEIETELVAAAEDHGGRPAFTIRIVQLDAVVPDCSTQTVGFIRDFEAKVVKQLAIVDDFIKTKIAPLKLWGGGTAGTGLALGLGGLAEGSDLAVKPGFLAVAFGASMYIAGNEREATWLRRRAYRAQQGADAATLRLLIEQLSNRPAAATLPIGIGPETDRP